jgi:nitrate/TMAO reductase-like tetraheme cytochrome c subunit
MTSWRKKGTGLHRNTISYIGLIITFIGALLTLFSTIMAISGVTSSPYLGIFSYMVFPAVIIFGGLVFLFGTRRESRRRKRTGTTDALPYPKLDLNDRRQRRKFSIISVILFFVFILLAVVGYNGFLFTESNRFCGMLCHVVMEPEYTAYKHSPHARVRCVDCHVGPGTSFYVKSKMSGAGMVSKTILANYTTPIPTPIKHLRPARETCEECHWPEKFYGAQLLQIPYFRYDEENTNDQISLIMKTGGGSTDLGQSSGIHWHMIVDNTITYAPADSQQQTIPWFQVRGRHGEVRTYTALDTDLSAAEIEALPRRNLDCIDCHNRPSHRFPPPDRSVDVALYNGHIPSDLPWIKKVATEALEAPYPTREQARTGIRNTIFNFYNTRYPELYRERATDISQAVEMALSIYEWTAFPEMNVDWTTYPENIGHRNWNGCFRCHDGRHATADGKVLSNECTICHTMPTRSALKPLGALAPASPDNWHPMLLTGRHAEVLCTACHTPGIRPSPQCSSCHDSHTDTPMWEMDCTDCHLEPGSLQPMEPCASCHAGLGGDHNAGGHPDAACTDCHWPHHWTVEGRETCSECHVPEDFEDEHYAPDACTDCHEFV